MTRVYLPTTLTELADAVLAGKFGAGHAAHAVTPAVREWYTEGDLEELEYAAMTDAALASLRLLAMQLGAASRYADRRVVIAADVADQLVSAHPSDPCRSAVLVTGEVALRDVVSAHVDGEHDGVVRLAVGQAVRYLDAADHGDDDASFVIDEAQSHELLWYDVTELSDLI